ncbi:hypothetical protein DFQ14_102243 [Halopolyspora algeriensis]|uniref:Uncharacterized protein n=1 Tax=Halopolyspora algeriensis TaxID=1500506 RepID=A0A368W030_9ACTN|nr:hypothetical protein [Halopolyspora algeriensis]RCW45941.1 hypothetical protein DFQ14_102243 [Halopolyspora algeriensis]TQM55354.1 hypothetical protein FHU43_0117 [Halopolyspora algeriensis]
MSSPGANRPSARPSASARGDYDSAAVEYVLRDRRWQGWSELLEWLRAEGVNDPHLAQGEVQALRQDAESAAARDAPFTNDADRLWRELKQ